jgi:hypothetical protein
MECDGRTILTFIAGDYGNSVVGVCTLTGKFELWTEAHISVFAFDLDGQQRREVILPYDALNKSLSNKNREFKYLEIMVCGEYVLLQHGCYVKGSGTTSSSHRHTGTTSSKGIIHRRELILYRLKPLVFSIELEYVRMIPLDPNGAGQGDSTRLEPAVIEKYRRRGQIDHYFVDIRREQHRSYQCGENNDISVIYAQTGGRDHLGVTGILPSGLTNEKIFTDRISFSLSTLRKQLKQFYHGDYHSLFGRDFLVYSKSQRKSVGYEYSHFNNNEIFILNALKPNICGEKPKRYTDYNLKYHMKIAGNNYVFLDSDDRLIAWPLKRIGQLPPMAIVFL